MNNETLAPSISSETNSDNPDSKRRTLLRAIAVGGISMAAAGLGGCTSEQSNVQEAPSNNESILPGQEASAQPTAGVLEPSPSSPANITPLETAPVLSEHEQAVAALEIEAGQDQEQLSKSFIDLMAKWNMAGAEDANASEMIDQGYSGNERETYAGKIAAEQKEIYAEAIFGEDWQSNEKVQGFITKQEGVNAGILARHIITANDPISFSKVEVFEKLIAADGDSSAGTLAIDSSIDDNTESIPKLTDLGYPNEDNLAMTYTVSYTSVDGKTTFDNVSYVTK